jgi:uncharacterized surface protein with fasciclin (FAS1) repeats
MMLRTWCGVVLVLGTGFFFSACGSGDKPAASSKSSPSGGSPGEVLPAPTAPVTTLPVVTAGAIVQKLEDAGEFGKFLHALTRAEAQYEIEGTGPVTVFAPTDAAFGNLPEETAKAINRNLAWYKRVLLNHMVAGSLTSEDLAAKDSVETLAGVKLPVTKEGDVITVGGARLGMKDIDASNGIIHSIDKVLLLPQE